MKVQKLRLGNFKRFHDKKLDFRDPETGLAEDLIVLVGQNGSGKSSVLQAIAAMLGAATDQLASPAELDWPGFDLSLASASWPRPVSIELNIEFSQDEIKATREYFARTIFPGHRFEGPVPRTDMEEILAEPWFYLFDGNHQYELGEMSGGERSIFPMIFDFANWTIHNSVILIDELELHLHPPLQQGLLKALRGLGKNNQFIITTHSDAITQIVPEESIRRL